MVRQHLVQLCKDIFDGDEFCDDDKQAAFDLLQYEQEAAEAFKQSHPDIWQFLEQGKVVSEADVWEEAELKFRSNTLQALFADHVGQGADFLCVYPMASDATFCRTAKNWDMNQTEDLGKGKLKPAHEKRKAAMQAMERLGTEYYGEGNAWTAYEGTKKLLGNKKEIQPADERDRTWLLACRDFYIADRDYSQLQKTYDEQVMAIRDTYRPDRFDRTLFDVAMSYFENDVIINVEGHRSPHIEHVLQA